MVMVMMLHRTAVSALATPQHTVPTWLALIPRAGTENGLLKQQVTERARYMERNATRSVQFTVA
jgi:hypothetical protein